MEYTMDDMRRVLGKDFDKYTELVLETHRGALDKEAKGFKRLKEVPDVTNKDEGTMIVMGKPVSKGKSWWDAK